MTAHRWARVAAVAVAAACLPLATAAQEGPFLDLSIEGPIRPATADAIARLVESSGTARLRDFIIDRGEPLATLCRAEACPDALADWNAAPAGLGPDAGRLVVTPLAPANPDPAPGDRRYVLAFDPAVPTAVDGKIGITVGSDFMTEGVDGAAPLDVTALIEDVPSLSAGGVPRPVENDAGDKVDLLARDVALFGASDRTLRLADGLTDQERDRLIAIIASDPAVARASRTATPSDVDFIYPDGVSFQAATETCGAVPADWPFDAAKVASIARFDTAMLARLGLPGPRRARVLVIDTGLGAALIENPAFRRGLYVDMDEMLSSPVAFARPGEAECLDRNGNLYPGDVFGTGAGQDSDTVACAAAGFGAAQVAPLPLRPKAAQTYVPDHGSFVAGLALGGPALLESYPDVARLVGITMFRVTRPPIDSSESVHSDSPDIRAALEYAGRIGADIINLSAKTGADKPFLRLDEIEDGLLVVAAGNRGENLDGIAPGNRPAALSDATLRSRMIVVGALQPGDDAWWASSARSAVKVDIAAPGASIASYGLDGARMCGSGTSAAAPLVSFTAAAISALGLSTPELIRARILTSADHVPALAQNVASGRVLNVAAALDLFVDQVLLTSETTARRGWISPDGGSLLSICPFDTTSRLAERRGLIDLSKLWAWRREDVAGQPVATFDHRLAFDGGFETWSCEVPTGAFAFFDLATGTRQMIDWSTIRSIIPTPFRAVGPALMAGGGEN